MLSKRKFIILTVGASASTVAYLFFEFKLRGINGVDVVGERQRLVGFTIKCAMLNLKLETFNELKSIQIRKMQFDQVLLARVFVNESELVAIEDRNSGESQ